jgi:hypothetical protein
MEVAKVYDDINAAIKDKELAEALSLQTKLDA